MDFCWNHNAPLLVSNAQPNPLIGINGLVQNADMGKGVVVLVVLVVVVVVVAVIVAAVVVIPILC